jgi:uncharacterized protein (TIGR00645 family)
VKSIERGLERLIFGSRWLQVPLYVGLILVLLVLSVKFFEEFIHLAADVWTISEAQLVLMVLSLVDLVMVANLIVMVIISGYENFVSHIEAEDQVDRLSWFGKLDAGSLKIKLAASIVAISSIHLLKVFLNVADTPNDKIVLLVVIHLTFLVSALMLAFLDRIAAAKAPAKGEAGP